MSIRPRVVVADDNRDVLAGTREMLERDGQIDVIGEAADGLQALDLVAVLKPDVLVLDIHLPKVRGIDVVRGIRERSAGTYALVLSSDNDEDYVTAAVEAGARGYLLKTARAAELVGAVHSIVRGDVVFESSVASRLFKQMARRDPVPREESPLTGREFEILKLVGMGLRNRQIAEQLQLSPRTVETHLSRAFAKLSVRSRTQALRHAVAQGWLVIPALF